MEGLVVATKYTKDDHRWTEADSRLGLRLVSAVRLGDDLKFQELWESKEFDIHLDECADVFLLLLSVAMGALRFGFANAMKTSTPDELRLRMKAVVEDLPQSALLNVDKVDSLIRFVISPTDAIPAPPRNRSELYAGVACCIAAIDMSMRGKVIDRGWSNRYDALASAMRRKRRAVADTYRRQFL